MALLVRGSAGRLFAAMAFVASLGGIPTVAAAEPNAPEGDEVDEAPRPPAAVTSVGAGAFLPWTMGARSDAQRALVHVQGGYSGAERGGVFQTVAEAQLFDRISLRAGGAYVGTSNQFRPEAGLRVDALRQERHGVDLAVLGVYETAGFNTVRAVTARVALSRTFGATRVVSNVGYGIGLAGGERYGDVRLAALRPVSRRMHLGLDSRFRIDLERDADEPVGEPDWETVAGPLATYAIDRFVVSATAGVAALKMRLAGAQYVGAIGTLGVGTVF